MTTKTSVDTTDFSASQKALLSQTIGKYACTEKNPCGVIFGKRDGKYFIADDNADQECNTFEDLLKSAQAWFEDFASNDQ